MSSKTIITALHQTASKLRSGARYEWGHVGRCNCGHLAQTVTEITGGETLGSGDIYRIFGQELSEWTEHANDYCERTGSRVEELIDRLSDAGFSRQDIQHLEYLSDDRVLRSPPKERRHLRRNRREDVATYMEALADIFDRALKKAA